LVLLAHPDAASSISGAPTLYPYTASPQSGRLSLTHKKHKYRHIYRYLSDPQRH